LRITSLGDGGDDPQQPLPRTDELPQEEKYMQPQCYGPFPYILINRRPRITLKPMNPDFRPIVLTGAEEGELQVVAELVEVLGGAS
jgi:hypothetical protein